MRGIAFLIWGRASAGGAPAPRRPAARTSLFAVELDDELFGDRDLDVVAQRQAAHDALLLVRIELQPLGHLPAAGVDVIVDARLQFRRRSELDRVAHLHQERRHRHLAAVHLEMAVRHHLAPLAAGGREAEAMHDVVEPELEQAQEVFTGDALLGLGPLEVLAELALEHAVDPLGLLLLPELHAEGGRLAAVEPVLARRIVAPLDRALVGEAARALQEELHAFAAAQPALRVTIPRHSRLLHPPPLRRAAPVVRNRRDVTDRGDLQPGGLQRADGRLAPRSGPPHEDLDLLEAVLHRLARGELGGRLGGKGRALARALEPGAAGARPGHDVAHPVRERDDRVVERRLDVRDTGAHLAPLAPLGALLPRCWLRFFGHALRSRLLRRCRRRCRRGRRGRCRRLLLDHHAPLGALPRAGVGVRALAAHRETAAVADAAVRADVHQALDVHRDVAAQVALDLELALDDLADPVHLVVGPRLHALAGIDVRLQQHAPPRRPPEPVDVRDRDLTPLLSRQVDASHSCHVPSPFLCSSGGFAAAIRPGGRHRKGAKPPPRLLPLSSFVARILADDPRHALTLDDLAVLTAHLDRWSYLHRVSFSTSPKIST